MIAPNKSPRHNYGAVATRFRAFHNQRETADAHKAGGCTS